MCQLDIQKGYKKQETLSAVQFFAEIPDFFLLLISAFFSKSLLVVLDLFDSFGELLKSATTALLSKKLSKDLRFEYNYGIGKIEAISALLCESVICFGVLLSIALSIYELIFPNKPSDLLIWVVGLKVIHVVVDVLFLVKQRRITKDYCGAITSVNYEASLASVLFDSVTLLSLLTVWVFRENPIGGYITPVITLGIAIYLMVSCVKRIRVAIDEITDKTLNEDVQLKILSVINQLNQRYSAFHAIKSRKLGDGVIVDLHISFDENTSFEEIANFKHDVKTKLDEILDACELNITI